MKNVLLKYCSVLLLAMSIQLVWSTNLWAASDWKPAPNFTLKVLGGKNLKLSEMTGNVVLINFWASWCAPCIKEMPLLNAIYKKYKPLGFTILGINIEENSDDARAFLVDRPVDFPILLDSQNQVSKLYKVIAMPTSVLIDRDGNLRYLHRGYKSGDEEIYGKYVKVLIRE